MPLRGKSKSTIIKYAIENSIFLLEQDVHGIIIACNTATALALDRIEKTFSVPVIGVVQPAAQAAAKMSQNGRIGVIGTNATVTSKVYEKEIQNHVHGAQVYSIPCPLLVPLVEENYKNKVVVKAIIKEYLRPFKKQKIDTLLLGCTHYPLLTSYIVQEMGDEVAVIDPAVACSIEASKRFSCANKQSQESSFAFFVSDDPKKFFSIGKRFVQFPLSNVKMAVPTQF